MKKDFIVFDKIKWHTDNNMPFDEAKKHFIVIMEFLLRHNLLSQEGKNIYSDEGVSREFSLNSDILTKNGNQLLSKFYKSYLRNFELYGKIEALKFLHNKLTNENKSTKG